ncbi:hypothetical protein K8Z61_15005 [Nocardioides sp. TRM66260-LWL]|uniref:hypothetical protein n=1 Tax=Nocardioides sp. TRM66260-LWL TaxID=2874478 RepID=UPI001CC71F25|nr:hypothetical protein [Nocardioides sp. TRM66260-LWL]MBZ5735801.1 hypothetical protein [Nocardioides sp. TRM66260-LWL]
MPPTASVRSAASPAAAATGPSPAPSRAHRRRVLALVRLAQGVLVGAIGVVLLTAWLGAPHAASGSPERTAAAAQDAVQAARVDRLMTRERCSPTGFGPSVIPARALLRTGDGVVRVVSFDRGWAAYEGRAPGTLVAVCLGRASRM